jgi:mono/diheme cytochrome c family protein
MSARPSRWPRLAAVAAGTCAVLAAAVVWLNQRGEDPLPATPTSVDPTPQLVEKGAYLARAGNCMGCHTVRGGDPYAGGRAIETPFGLIHAPNLTPDEETGLGRWTSDEFWRAMHNGRSRDGRLLYPAFPYPNYTRITREDSDAIYAYLRTLPPVKRPNASHQLRFPYNTQAALAVWRALFFRPGVYEPQPSQSAEWNRGAYLVEGLGHCAACHAPRNLLGATQDSLGLSGGLIPMQGWYAPSLTSPVEAGVAGWPQQEVVDLLRTGVSAHGSTMGPMAEVVFRSTQYLSEADLRAMAAYLQSLPQQAPPQVDPEELPRADPGVMRLGGEVYVQHCAQCHGDQGEGKPGAFPALAGNRAVTLPVPVNVIRAVLDGGYPPSTAGNPRPHGMPPYGQALNDEEVAAVVTYIRQSWGHRATPVNPLDVLQLR